MLLSMLSMTVKGIILLVGAVYGFAALLRPEDAKWVKNGPLKIFLGMFLIGMWGHSIWIAYLAVLIAIPVLSKSRSDAAALYVIALLSMPVLYYKIAIGSHYLFAVTKYVFCGLGLAIALMMKPKSPMQLRSRFDIPILIVLWLEITQARDPMMSEVARQMLPIVLTIVLPYFFVSRALNSAEDVRRFVLAIALGGFVMALVATVEAHTHWLVYKQVEGLLGASSKVNAFQQMRGGLLRAPASFAESTSLGTFLCIGAVAALASRPSFATRRKWLIAVGVLLVGLLAPNSRGALIGIALGLLLFDFYRQKWSALFTKLGAAGVVYLMMLTAAQFSDFFANLVGKGGETGSSNDYRMLLLRRGMEEIHKHPILGTNLKDALANLQDIQQGQQIVDLVNGYVTYGLTMGYAGIVGLFVVFAALMFAMITARRKLRIDPMLIDIGAFVFAVAGLMIVVCGFTSFGGEGSTFFYMVAALGSSLYALRPSMRATAGDGVPALVPVGGPAIRAQILADREAARARSASISGKQIPEPL